MAHWSSQCSTQHSMHASQSCLSPRYQINEVGDAAPHRDASIPKPDAPRAPFLAAKLPKGCCPVKREGDDRHKAKGRIRSLWTFPFQRHAVPLSVLPVSTPPEWRKLACMDPAAHRGSTALSWCWTIEEQLWPKAGTFCTISSLIEMAMACTIAMRT